jgi:hypothetical protein
MPWVGPSRAAEDSSLSVQARAHLLWAPRRASWWMDMLFAVGSLCFLVGPLPVFLGAVGPRTDALVFVVGSFFFTAAAALQLRLSSRAGRSRELEWWSSVIQLLGTLFFNVTTTRALATGAGSSGYDRLVWRPDAFGSVCFLVSGALAYVVVSGGLARRPPRSSEGVAAAANLLGCVAFGLSAIGAYVLPTSGSEVNVRLANATTALGALGFLVGALVMLRHDTAVSGAERAG